MLSCSLTTQLQFASGSLKQYLNVEYTDKLESEATPADDIEGTLYKFIPSDYTKSENAFQTTVEADAKTFKPLGEKIASYVPPAVNGKGKGKANGAVPAPSDDDDAAVVFEVYHVRTRLVCADIRQHGRLPASENTIDECRSLSCSSSRVEAIFRRTRRCGNSSHCAYDTGRQSDIRFERRKIDGVFTYHFAGYTSVYPFWCFPDLVRVRLSQFVILPTYQHYGHGCESAWRMILTTARLYQALFSYVREREGVAELTVEDPAEAFEDLRDRNDLRFLVKEGIPDDPMFLQGVGVENRDGRNEWETTIRKKYKIAQVHLRVVLFLTYSASSTASWKCFSSGNWTQPTPTR